MQYVSSVKRDEISTHSLLAEGDRRLLLPWRARMDFNPLPPRGGRRRRRPRRAHYAGHFNPLPPRGGRLPPFARRYIGVLFQPTPSSRRETSMLWPCACTLVFQPTPSSRRETRPISADRRTDDISTHSLLAEGDAPRWRWRFPISDFNPLPPRGGRPCRWASV